VGKAEEAACASATQVIVLRVASKKQGPVIEPLGSYLDVKILEKIT
jgi:hypothetical protein